LISSVSRTQAVSYLDLSTASQAGSAAQSPGDSASLSGFSSLYQKLQALQQQDPAKLKEALQEIAQKLSDAAKSATDPNQQKALQSLSDKFGQAAQTGDLSGLQPPAGGGHHHRAHAAGAQTTQATDLDGDGDGSTSAVEGVSGSEASSSAASATGSAASATNPADLNGDGVVTAEEQAIYTHRSPGSILVRQPRFGFRRLRRLYQGGARSPLDPPKTCQVSRNLGL
jgi:hypothetical protein